jgi:hypothetical protein
MVNDVALRAAPEEKASLVVPASKLSLGIGPAALLSASRDKSSLPSIKQAIDARPE